MNVDADISVVIPVRNRPRQIHAAIDSVLSQSIRPREILIIDDASTDDTAAQIEARASRDVRIRLLRLETNRGGSYARNCGIDSASSSMIAFLDSDDVWLPTKLERQLSVVSSTPTERYLCFSNLEIDNFDGCACRPWNVQPFQNEHGAKQYVIHDDQAIQTSTFLLPTNLARSARFDERLRRHQDIDFVLRLESVGVAFLYVDDVLVRYSADPGETRVSQRSCTKPSLVWMDIARDYLSDAEIRSYYLKHVFEIEARESPMSAIQRVLSWSDWDARTMANLARTLARTQAPAWFKYITKKFRSIKGK